MNQRELRNRMWQAADELLLDMPDLPAEDGGTARIASCAVDQRAFLVVTDREVYRVTVEVL